MAGVLIKTEANDKWLDSGHFGVDTPEPSPNNTLWNEWGWIFHELKITVSSIQIKLKNICYSLSSYSMFMG